MNSAAILKRIKSLKAQNEQIANTLTVLEKEIAGGGAPTVSTKKQRFQERLDEIIAERDQRTGRRQIKK